MASLLPSVAATLPTPPGGATAAAEPMPGDTAFAAAMDEALPESGTAIEAPPPPLAGALAPMPMPIAMPMPMPIALGAAAQAAASVSSAVPDATASSPVPAALANGASAGLLPALAAEVAAGLALAASAGRARDLPPAWPPPGLSALFPGPAAAAAAAAAVPVAVPLLPARIALPAQADAMAQALARAPALLSLPRPDDDERGLLGGTDAFASDAWAPLGSLAGTSTSLPRLELPPSLAAPVPMHSPRFADETGARVQWLAAQGGGEATLRISPDGLGPVEIRLSLDGDRVDVALHAAQADTRQALEQALPRLREMLAQQGLQLGHADVGQRQSSGASDHPSRERRRIAEGEDEGLTAAAAAVDARRVIVGSGSGMLDLYA